MCFNSFRQSTFITLICSNQTIDANKNINTGIELAVFLTSQSLFFPFKEYKFQKNA